MHLGPSPFDSAPSEYHYSFVASELPYVKWLRPGISSVLLEVAETRLKMIRRLFQKVTQYLNVTCNFTRHVQASYEMQYEEFKNRKSITL